MGGSLLVIELDQPNWEGALGLWADSGPTFPIVLHFTRPFFTYNHEGEQRALVACGGDVVQKFMPQSHPTAKDKSAEAYYMGGILGWFYGLPVVNPIAWVSIVQLDLSVEEICQLRFSSLQSIYSVLDFFKKLTKNLSWLLIACSICSHPLNF